MAREGTHLTSSEAWQRYRDIRDAYDAVVTFGSSYSIGDRTVTKHDAPQLRAEMSYWVRQARALEAVETDNPAQLPGVLVASYRGTIE